MNRGTDLFAAMAQLQEQVRAQAWKKPPASAPRAPAAPPNGSLLTSIGVTLSAAPILPSGLDTIDIGGRPVGPSADLTRIAALPRRILNVEDPDAARRWTLGLRKKVDKCDCVERWGFCINKLKPVQGWALDEAYKSNGMLGSICVGGGKGGIDILLPWAVPDCKIAVLLIPANLRAQMVKRDYPQWSVHFNTPNLAGDRWFVPGKPVIHIVTYSELSGPKSSNLLELLGPDLIIADESHMIRSRNAARTKRFLRYLEEHPEVRFCAHSGTLTSKSIKDYAHLSEHALRDNTPLPKEYMALEDWAGALDAETARTFASPMGALSILCEPGEPVRSGFRRRLIDTPGVVATQEGSLGTSLIIAARRPDPVMTPDVDAKVKGIRSSWQRPDGEELVDVLQQSSVARQMALGFYYRWVWPADMPELVKKEWLTARKEWHSELRERLSHATEHMDSPLLLTNAAIRWYEGFSEVLDGGHTHGSECYGEEEFGEDGSIRQSLICTKKEGLARRDVPPKTRHPRTWASATWPRWKEIKNVYKPTAEAVWVSDYLVRDCVEWAKSNVGLIWYSYDAFGKAIAKLGDIPLFGAGRKADEGLTLVNGKQSIVLSMASHGRGKNLQNYSKMLVTTPPASGDMWEQVIGRCHRQGQQADEVLVEVYRHIPEMVEPLKRAREKAIYMQETLGSKMKLCYANYDLGDE